MGERRRGEGLEKEDEQVAVRKPRRGMFGVFETEPTLWNFFFN